MDALIPPPALIWHFGPCAFDEHSLELSVNGQPVTLERKPLEVLRHLLRHAGEVVTKDELQTAVWPGRVLSDTVLTKAISRIREELGDSAQSVIKTVHGYGYRLVAAVTVRAATPAAPPPPALGLKAGESPPLRPQWKLVQHLDSGSSGEVWRVAHAKTGDTRVCKFALHAESLISLKREITLFRVLRAQLGDEAPIADILDWNLEEAPYFLELADYRAGNLSDWAASRGGLAALTLAGRLELFAEIVEAVARVHAVGVLHKDIKPSNILIAERDGSARALLADFGGGGVLADDLTEKAGITRLGFSQMLPPAGIATPLYAAPELLEGQPQTVASDIYALGVLLHQFVAGDFRKPLASGWEANVSDELLREDIATAAAYQPLHRLASAQELAQRIRQLEQRRAARASERAQAQRREVTEKTLERLRLRRRWLLATIAALSLGLTIAGLQYARAERARQRAEASADTALATGRFMFEGLLSALDVSQQGRKREVSVKDLLDNAARAADEQLQVQPEIAFHVRTALSTAYNQIDDGVPLAKRQEELAHQALRALWAVDPKRAVEVVPPEGLWVISPDDKTLFETLLATARTELGGQHPAVLGLTGALSDAEFRYGSLQAARRRAQEAETLAEMLGDLTAAEDNTAFRIRLAREDADFTQAEALLAVAEKRVAAHAEPSPVSRAYLQMDRGITRLLRGDTAQAAADLDAGFLALKQLQAPGTWYYRFPLAYTAMLRASQGRSQEARQMTAEWRAILARDASGEVDMPMEALIVAETDWRLGDTAAAEGLLRALHEARQPGRPRSIANFARLQLAAMRLQAGDTAGAREWVARVRPDQWYDYRDGHPRFAVEAEVDGLLARAQGRDGEGLRLLQDARRLYRASYAPDHWRVQRIEKLLGGNDPSETGAEPSPAANQPSPKTKTATPPVAGG